ncbi:MAG TPA: outer membrane beta-barrel protein [Malonomonas sp.]
MKRTKIISKLPILLMLLLLFSGCAKLPTIVPEGTVAKNFYAGFGVGGSDSNAADSNDDGSVSGIATSDTDVMGKLFFGYLFNQYLAVEASYQDFGETDFVATSTGGPSWAAGPVRTDQEAQAYDLTAIGRWPISERWAFIGKLGWSWWENKETYTEGAFVSSEKTHGNNFTYGGGLEFDHGYKDRIVYRFELDHHEVGNDDYDVNTATANFIYRFP